MDQFDTMPMESHPDPPGATGENLMKALLNGHIFFEKMRYILNSLWFVVFQHLKQEYVQDPAPQALQTAKDWD